jgi:lipopolysaccharide/colanic/teichoic acid biosynthesis glycosyltransferase
MNSSQTESQPAGDTVVLDAAAPRWKRALDITLIIIALPVLLPVMLCVALIVRLSSEGPILFRQERVGFLGKKFMCFKFRTMIAGIETKSHEGHLENLITSNKPMVKMDAKNDPRIIAFGGPLRSSGLDELPQIINILRGEMSLVGPRPCTPFEFGKYKPAHKERFKTLPGLTGLWQVSGKNNTTFEEMIRLDVDYVKRKSLWLDIWIVVKTIPAMLVQMIETRVRRKAHARTVQPAVSEPAANP